MPFTSFLDNSSIFAVSDDRIMFYSGAQKPTVVAEKLLSDEVQGVYYGDEYVGLVVNSTQSGNRYRMDVYHRSGELQVSIEFDIDFPGIFCFGKIRLSFITNLSAAFITVTERRSTAEIFTNRFCF